MKGYMFCGPSSSICATMIQNCTHLSTTCSPYPAPTCPDRSLSNMALRALFSFTFARPSQRLRSCKGHGVTILFYMATNQKKNCRGNQKEISLATCHHFSLRKNSGEKFVKLSSQRADGRPRVPRGTQAKFGSQFVKGFQETDLAGHASGERAIRCASRNFLIGRVYLPSPPLETKCLQSPFCDSSAPECLASSGHHEFEPTQL